MTVIKDFVDVLEIAVRIERQGTEFYKKLYEKTQAPQAKTVFSLLAAEEEKHIGIFRKMLEEVADYSPRYDYPGEYGVFLNEFASGFLREIEKTSKEKTPTNTNEALDIGILFEKESILFYVELKEEGKFGSQNEKILQDIIDEERSHWQKLACLKSNIRS